MTSISKIKLLLAAGFCLLAPQMARAQNTVFHINCEEIGDDFCTSNSWDNRVYVDFASNTNLAGHRTWASSPFTPIAVDTNFRNLKRYTFYLNVATTTGYCLDVTTSGANTMDTRIWFQNAANAWVSLSDDYTPENSTTLSRFSHARVWVKNADFTARTRALTIAPFSTTYNKGDFYLKYQRLELSEADCTTGQAGPWIKFKDGGAVTFGNNN